MCVLIETNEFSGNWTASRTGEWIREPRIDWSAPKSAYKLRKAQYNATHQRPPPDKPDTRNVSSDIPYKRMPAAVAVNPIPKLTNTSADKIYGEIPSKTTKQHVDIPIMQVPVAGSISQNRGTNLMNVNSAGINHLAREMWQLPQFHNGSETRGFAYPVTEQNSIGNSQGLVITNTLPRSDVSQLIQMAAPQETSSITELRSPPSIESNYPPLNAASMVADQTSVDRYVHTYIFLGKGRHADTPFFRSPPPLCTSSSEVLDPL